MKIAIASGKGGTGKTTIATNLAVSIAQSQQRVQYLDCDVEEPNGHVFLKPDIESKEEINVPIPQVDADLCIACGKCAQLCQYSAITCIKDKVLVFEELCHSCGGCMEICPTNAISEIPRTVGVAEFGKSECLSFGHGILDIGKIQTTSVIKYVKNKAIDNGITIIDVPPGTSCPVIEAIKDVDFVLLVTEPTPFGLNDLELAVGMVRELKLPFAVAINRSDIGDDAVVKYCQAENIKVLLEIPNDRKIAENYSNGKMMVEVLTEYKQKFVQLFDDISKLIS